ncbi:MAG: lipocalin-like domain-containing protein [Lysobacterales bacterium]|jgi:hypothetical protein
MTGELVGAWTLCAWRIYHPGRGEPSLPFGSDPQGLLIYTADGWMSATVCRAGRPAFPDGSSPRALEDEVVADAFRSAFHYAGPYRIEDGCIIHSVRYSLNPSMVGTEQRRVPQFVGNRLTLLGEETLPAGLRRHELEWRRATF